MARKKKEDLPEFVCSDCGKTYKTKSGLGKHETKYHPVLEKPTTTKKTPPKKTPPKKPTTTKKKAPKKPTTTKKTPPKKKAPSKTTKTAAKRKPPKKEITTKRAPSVFGCPFDGCAESFETKDEAMDHIKKDHKKIVVSEDVITSKVDGKPVAKITRIIPPMGNKNYGNMNFIFRGKKRVKK